MYANLFQNHTCSGKVEKIYQTGNPYDRKYPYEKPV